MWTSSRARRSRRWSRSGWRPPACSTWCGGWHEVTTRAGGLARCRPRGRGGVRGGDGRDPHRHPHHRRGHRRRGRRRCERRRDRRCRRRCHGDRGRR
ncbi:hypothetical protein CXF45_05280 [Corynebacterium bovis]|nr:hypothetical protein CXF38_03750 [Corynebacterium bovis]RRO90778.1 hypothetical protein CXF45_05280 [Corynebacterium bovis]